MLPQQYCLRWKYHHSNLQSMFSQLLDRGCFCDVTLACEGQLIRAHRVVLCACSTFFDTVLTNYASERDPIIILKDVTFADIKCLIEFMYKGEINVEHANLASLLKTADDLKIKGLAEVTWRDDEDIPPPPTPQTEFHSPSQSRNRDSHNYDSYGHEAQHRSHSPDPEREQKTPSPKHAVVAARMPTLTPIPTSAVSIVTAAGSPNDSYLGPKRKRGRPPLDDAYDVFNVRKLGHYSDQADSGSYLEGSQCHDEQNNQGTTTTTTQRSRPNSPLAASVVYQQHIQQQKQRLRYRPTRVQHDDDQIDDEAATEPEWITSSLEHENEPKDPLGQEEEEDDGGDEEMQDIKEENDEINVRKRTSEKRSKDSTTEYTKTKTLKRKNSKEETLQHKSDNEDELETDVPQTVEEIETVKQPAKDKSSSSTTNASYLSATTNNSLSSATSSSSSSPSTSAAHKNSASSHSSHHHHSHHSQHSHSHSHHPPPPPPLHHPHHYGKYPPEGYLINEHGILMTHDFIHAPTASIPTSSTSASNGHHPDEYVDIKMEEYNESELRLTTEEMSQWQDVIKMDDYLAKGRRPQFWEEPFTRRVLDAIKNKRLEMKKAARILGVSYGTLYGRYREVYGCLKHPYSSTSMRPSQSSSLSVQPRYDIVWPSPKPGDIGKLRPKDLSELWTRPQI